MNPIFAAVTVAVDLQTAHVLARRAGHYMMGVFTLHATGSVKYTGKIPLWLLCHLFNFNVQKLRLPASDFVNRKTISLILSVAASDMQSLVDRIGFLHPGLYASKRTYECNIFCE